MYKQNQKDFPRLVVRLGYKNSQAFLGFKGLDSKRAQILDLSQWSFLIQLAYSLAFHFHFLFSFFLFYVFFFFFFCSSSLLRFLSFFFCSSFVFFSLLFFAYFLYFLFSFFSFLFFNFFCFLYFFSFFRPRQNQSLTWRKNICQNIVLNLKYFYDVFF